MSVQVENLDKNMVKLTIEVPAEELEKAITEYIDYYTNDRPQRGLGVLTPMEFHEKQRLAA